jgi:putative hemolysin
MLLLKGCPRCHGDLVLDQDARTAYLYCVQCGHILSRDQERACGICATRHGLIHLPPPQRARTEQADKVRTLTTAG